MKTDSKKTNITIEINRITDFEYSKNNKKIVIYYSYSDSFFGKILVASTNKGVCYLGFEVEKNRAFQCLKDRFTNAFFVEKKDDFQQSALDAIEDNQTKDIFVKLHLKATDFQIQVWKSLLKIPKGSVFSYGKIAQDIGNPKAVRAVGTAIGNNPISIIIPCHRVVQSSGKIGGYFWGTLLKSKILAYEGVESYDVIKK